MGIKKKVIAIFSIILFLFIPISLVAFYGFGNSQFYISDFNLYKNDFQIIANKMLSFKDSSNLPDSYTVWIDHKNNHVFCNLNGQTIEMNDKESNAINNVISAFDNSTLLNRIQVYKNRVTFCTEGNWYAVAYMIDDSKPQFMSVPTEAFNIKVKKIEENWYHIIGN